MNIFYFLLFIALIEARRSNWVDPHEMKINVKNKLERSLSENDKSPDTPKESVTYSAPSVEENMPLIYLKRTIKLILQAANRENDNPNEYTGTYKYTLDSEEYKFLVGFADNKNTNTEDIRKMDTVLSTIFSKSYKNDIFNFGIGIKEQILSYNTLFIVGIAICCYVVYTFIKNKEGLGFIFSYIIFLCLIVDYGFRYRSMYEDMEEHNMKVIYTNACDTTKMSWNQYFQFVFSKKDCEKRMVTPLDVGLNQLKYIIIIPLESLGTGMGKFSKELWENLPFPWNILIFPLILVFITSIIFIFMLVKKNTTFKVKLFHLLHFEFGKEAVDGNRVTEKIVDKLLEATIHRRIEVISSPVKTEAQQVEYKNDNTKENVKNQTNQESISESESINKADDDRTENTSADGCAEDKKEK